MNDKTNLFITIIFLIFVLIFYSQQLLDRIHFIALRLIYYGYWYYLLYTNTDKFITILLTFGYLIITSIYSPSINIEDNEDKVNTYILGYKRGYQRGIEKEKAIELIVLGFIEKFREELPMEYAVELNQLLKQNL